jgi:hypothetical protein
MKVLILSVTAGQGPSSNRNGDSDELARRGIQCSTLDILKYIDPIICDLVSKGYLISTKHLPIAYGVFIRLRKGKKKPVKKPCPGLLPK